MAKPRTTLSTVTLFQAMTNYYLRDGIYHCHVDDGIVLLNALTGKYLALPSTCKRAFAALSDSAGTASNPSRSHNPDIIDADVVEVLEALIKDGLITTNASEAKDPRALQLRCNNSLMGYAPNTKRRGVYAREVKAFAIALCKAKYRMWKLPFASQVHWFEERHRSNADKGPHGVTQIAEALDSFRSLRLWAYTATHACYFDSMVLLEYLDQLGLQGSIVLGVQSKPFAAHAWVQWQDTILNDTLEKTASYTPIFAA